MIFINFINKKTVSVIGVALTLAMCAVYAKMQYSIYELEQKLLSEGEISTSLAITVTNLEVEVENLSKKNEFLLKDKEELEGNIKAKEEEISELINEKESLQEDYEELKVSKAKKSESKENKAIEDGSLVEDDSSWKSMTVNASAYTLVEHGDVMGGTGLTSTGKVPTANRTIAVDPNIIPYGSLIQYNGVTYVAEDTGGMIKGNKVDIYMNTLSEAVSFGRKDISILVKTP